MHVCILAIIDQTYIQIYKEVHFVAVYKSNILAEKSPEISRSYVHRKVGMYGVPRSTGTRENGARLFIDITVQPGITTFLAE